MNEYAITLKMSWWGFFFPRSAVDTFVVVANDAAHAERLARSGFVSGLEDYDQSFEEEENAQVDLSHLTIRVLNIQKI